MAAADCADGPQRRFLASAGLISEKMPIFGFFSGFHYKVLDIRRYSNKIAFSQISPQDGRGNFPREWNGVVLEVSVLRTAYYFGDMSFDVSEIAISGWLLAFGC